jgi:hypothetical protein
MTVRASHLTAPAADLHVPARPTRARPPADGSSAGLGEGSLNPQGRKKRVSVKR